MLQATTLGGQAAALAGSLLFHAGVVFAFSGHAAPLRRSPSAQPLVVEVSALFESPAAVAPTPTQQPTVPMRRTARPAHTHRYPVAHDHDATPHEPELVHAPVSVSPPAAPRPLFSVAVPPPPSALAAPRFAIDLGVRGSRAPGFAVAGTGSPGAGDTEPVGEAAVDIPARLLRGAPPAYPRQAAEADIEADVPLEIVVDAAGHVQSARVLRPVGHGLEAASLKALRAYHFSPALLRGRPTPVRMKWTMVFRLQ